MCNLNSIILLSGPTGIGKTEISIRIARFMTDIEIISADSMQVYKYLDIGTAKPNREVLASYRHHCIDIVDPAQDFDVKQYVCHVQKCLKDILTRNKKPVIVGGSGLYIKSLMNPVFNGPGRDQNIRKRLMEIVKNEGNDYLFKELKKHDPTYASKISPNDTKRMIRALEVFQLTDKPFSSFHRHDQLSENSQDDFYVICLEMERNILYERINQRVDKMIENGFIEEARKIYKQYGHANLNAMQGLGYKQMFDYFQGIISLEQAIELIKRETRHFAKRQLSWFKNQIRIDSWIQIKDKQEDIQEAVERIVTIMKEQGY